MPLRLLLLGTGPFAVPAFEAIRQAGHAVVAVVTRPLPEVRSRKGPPDTPVRDWAVAAGLSWFDPPTVNSAEGVALLHGFEPELLVVCDYGEILCPEALATATLGGINLHGSLLPAYRGAAPVQRALLSGDRVTGVSVIHMTPKLDGGPILATRETEIRDSETAGELETRLATLGVPAVAESVDALRHWDRESPIGRPQDPARVSRAPRLHKREGEIDWTRTTRQVDCHIRGMQPWPGAFTFVRTDSGKPPLRVAIKRAEPEPTGSDSDTVPGQQVGDAGQVSGAGLSVATADGAIRIVSLQPAGRKEMTGAEFLRGHARTAGPLRFGPAALFDPSA